jgi:hypothetical protein
VLLLQMWEGSQQDRQKLQQFLVEELGLRFEVGLRADVAA